MSNLFSGISGRFRGGNRTKSPGPLNGVGSPTSPTGSQLSGSSSTTNLTPRVPSIPGSPSFPSQMSLDEPSRPQQSNNTDMATYYGIPRPLPLWLNNVYSKHIVRGNFMTLSARPKTVEQGEWIAHQVMEHYRNLWNFVRVIHDKDENGTSICNVRTCDRMSAGGSHSFTWLNQKKEPVEVPAHEYITLMQRWISGKIDNTNIFPTEAAGVSFAFNPSGPEIVSTTYASASGFSPGDQEAPIPAGPTNLNTSLASLVGPGDWVGKSSGFPQEFVDVCQTIFRQMFRVYAHLYWAHFVDPFYHLGLDKHLNSCFSHFILTATEIDMLKPIELEPMQALIDLWAANGTFPSESKAFACANLAAGQRLAAMSGSTLGS